MNENVVKYVLQRGGRISPLLAPFELAHGTGQMNPSILIDNQKIIVNIRNVGYVLIHSENEQRFPSRWGPLTYTHPENDRTLRTYNIYAELDNEFRPLRMQKVDTSRLDVEPKWEFIGLEDARLVRWEGKLYMSGVRRDTTTNGVGRMELSEIEVTDNAVREVSRLRIESTNPNTYCEKNWMPVLDLPFHYVKWSNPTEVVRVNFETKAAETVFRSTNVLGGFRDFRGSSQVLPWGENRIALVHEVDLFNNELGQKDAYYYHRFLVWDRDWNIIQMSDDFHFMTERIGFSCGLAILDDKVLMPFGNQDNSAYLLEIPIKLLEGMLHGRTTEEIRRRSQECRFQF